MTKRERISELSDRLADELITAEQPEFDENDWANARGIYDPDSREVRLASMRRAERIARRHVRSRGDNMTKRDSDTCQKLLANGKECGAERAGHVTTASGAQWVCCGRHGENAEISARERGESSPVTWDT